MMNVNDNLDTSVFESEYYCGGKLFDEPRKDYTLVGGDVELGKDAA